MSAGTYNIKIDQGSNYELRLEVDQPAGTDLNLTDYTIASEIRDTAGGNLIATFGTTWIDEATGRFKLTLDDSVTTTLPTGIIGVYDVEITSSNSTNNFVTRLIQGSVTVDPGVTV